MNRIHFGAFAAVVGCMFLLVRIAVAVEYIPNSHAGTGVPAQPGPKPTAPSNSVMSGMAKPAMTIPGSSTVIDGNSGSWFSGTSTSTTNLGQRIVYNGQVYIYQYSHQTGGTNYYHWVTQGSASNISINPNGNINRNDGITSSNGNYAKLNGGSISNTWDMFYSSTIGGTATTGTNNTLHLVQGTLSGTVNVGQGTIYINNELGTLNVTGAINTNAGNSNWVIEKGDIVGGKLSSTDDAEDTYYIGGAGASDVIMRGGAEINVQKGSTIYIGYGTDYNYADLRDFTLTTDGSDNVITVYDRITTTADTKFDLSGGGNQINLLLDDGISYEFKGTIDINNTDNILYIGNKTVVTDNMEVNINDHRLTERITDNATFEAYWGGAQSIQHNNHTLFIDGEANYKGWKLYEGNGINVVVDLDATAPTMTGQVVFDAGTASLNDNNIFISGSGTHDNWNGSFIGSNEVNTNVYVDGGTTSLVVSGGADTMYVLTSGQVRNIQAREAGSALTATYQDDYVADYEDKDKVDLDHSVWFQGTDNDYQSYSLLNLGSLTLAGSNNLLTIGNMDRQTLGSYGITNQVSYSATDLGNQITADEVTVYATNKLVIHEDADRMGSTDTWIDAGQADRRNVINSLTVASGGHVTIDRTTIHGTDEGSAVITVERGGILSGFGEINAADNNNPMRAQVIGNVDLQVGAVLMAYDGDYWDAHNPYNTAAKGPNPSSNYAQFACDEVNLRGVTFEVANGSAVADSGTLFLNQRVELRTRLFHDDDDNRDEVKLINDDSYGLGIKTQLADGWKAVTAEFKNTSGNASGAVWNGVDDWSGYLNPNVQTLKVQYVPVFGYNYDLSSKLLYNIYSGQEDTGDDKTYRFRVLETNNEIDGYRYNNGTETANANHLFNRLILRSDMLGNYMFLWNEDGSDVYLRYRMIANHPINGGIKSVITSSNNMVTSQYLDEIRYPFKNWDTDLQHLDDDPAWNNGTLGTDLHGFNGDIIEWYEHNWVGKFDNYTPEYIADWDRLLHGMQLHVTSAAEMDDAMAQLNSGVYATASDANLNTMNEFIHNRERNSISALFGVESDQEEASGSAFANLNASNGYVSNPIRFWASGFGRLGKQRTNSRAMGYDTDVWGGAVGVVKEYCDTYFGLTIGHARSSHKWDNMPTNFKSKSYIGEVHAGARIFDLGFIEVHGNYSYNEQETSRGINYANYYIANYKADWVDHVYGGGIRLGYQKPFAGKWLFVPTLGITVMHNRSQEFAEESRGPNGLSPRLVFKKGAMDRTVVRTPVMMRLSRSWAICDFLVSPEIRAGFTPIMGQRSGRSVAKWAGNPTDNRYFTSRSGGKGAYEAIFGATLEVSRKGRFYAAGNYDYEYSPNAFAHSFSIQAGMNF